MNPFYLLPIAISRVLPLINSLKLHKLCNVVKEGEDDHQGDVAKPLTDSSLNKKGH